MNFLLNKMAYSLRSATNPCKKNYSDQVVNLPRAERVKPKTADQPYPIEVVEEDGDRVKVHYVDEGRKTVNPAEAFTAAVADASALLPASH